MRIKYTSRAYRDLASIIDTISADDQGAARRVVGRLEAAVDLLTFMPKIGRTADDLPGDVRQFAVRPFPYLIVYRLRPDVIEIITIWHMARSRDDLLSS